MYGEQDKVTAILDRRRFTRRGRKGPDSAQVQYQVQWSDTIIDKWALPLYERLGYLSHKTEPAAEDPWEHKCLICSKPLAPPEAHRHRHCGGPIPEHQPRTRAHKHGEDTDLVKVQWRPRYEPVEFLLGIGCKHMIDEWTNRTSLVATPPPSRTREAPSHYQQVGPYRPMPISHQTHTRDRAVRSTCFKFTPSRPDTDSLPPTKASGPFLTRQRVPTTTQSKDGPPRTTRSVRIVCHAADGSTIGCLTTQQTTQLLQRYHYMRTHHPDVLHTHSCPTFPHAVAGLLARYRISPKTRRGARPYNPREHHATPPAVRTALQQAFDIESERFATPLTCSATCTQYWTPHREDAVFAAQHDAYSSYLVGSNLCNPGDDDKDMYKALKWAITSAQAEYTPVVAVLLLAAKPGAGYLRLVDDTQGKLPYYARYPDRRTSAPPPTSW